jgi:molybdopterin-binding protein
MKVSARNLLTGTIKSIKEGAVNNELVLEVAPRVEIVSIITKSSCDRLGLKVGGKAYAMVKASSVMIATD